MTIDNFTLLICLCVAAILLAIAFGAVWLAQRASRAPLLYSASFLAGAISCILFLLPPHATNWYRLLSIVIGDSFVSVFLTLLQLGVRSYLGIKRHQHIIWLPLTLSVIALYFFTQVQDSMFARIIILGLVGFVVRLQIGIDLLSHAHRRSYRLLAAVMFLFAAVSLWQIVGTVFRGAPADYFRQDLVQSSVLFLYLVFLIATGLLLFLLNNDELVRRLEEEAATDFLTGAFNRRGIERILRAEIDRNRRGDAPLSIALIDIDHFKRINDREGHAEGDRIVQEIARLSRLTLRPYDSVGRLGGDEFVAVLPGTGPGSAQTVAERIRAAVATTLHGVTVSVGVATNHQQDGPDDLLRRADEALYDAKREGRNRVYSG